MSQIQVNAIHRACREFTARLRVSLAAESGLVDRCGSDFADELHEMTCKRLGLDPKQANNSGHPWNGHGMFRKRK